MVTLNNQDAYCRRSVLKKTKISQFIYPFLNSEKYLYFFYNILINMDDNFFENPSHPLDLSLSDLNELRL